MPPQLIPDLLQASSTSGRWPRSTVRTRRSDGLVDQITVLEDNRRRSSSGRRNGDALDS
jgi:hypothetical protein